MLKFFTYTATAIGMLTMSAQADDVPSNLNDWIDQASKAVEAKMEYPKTATLLGETDTNTFVVTVNRQGDILEVTKNSKTKRTYFNKASSRALRYVDLPDLPSSYKKDTLSFALVLDYGPDENIRPRPEKVVKLSANQLIALSPEKPETGL